MIRFASLSAAFFMLTFAVVYYFLLTPQHVVPISLPSWGTTTPSPAVEPARTAPSILQPIAKPFIEPEIPKVEFNVERVTQTLQSSENYTSYVEPVGEYSNRQLRHGFVNRTYHTYLGQGAVSKSPRQTIILLHEQGRTGASLVDMWKETADLHGLYLIAPDSIKNDKWSRLANSRDFFHALIDHAEDEIVIDRDQLYLFGHGSGGTLATQILAKQTLPFRAIATHAGFENADALGMVEQGLPKRIPISLYLGDNDDATKIKIAKATAAEFTKAGHEVSLYVIPDHTHWYYGIGPDLNKLIWADLSRK